MSIFKNFSKYHSLGNDFIIFDWYKRPLLYIQNELQTPSWKQFVIRTCNRNYGVGADGVIILTSCPQEGIPEMLIFNSDGTQAENCLNGLRCVAHYMFTRYSFPGQFKIKMGEQVVSCSVQVSSNQDIGYDIITTITAGIYKGEKTIAVGDGEEITGHIVTMGNPHFIALQQTSLEWLKQWGGNIETNKEFSQRTNVEFVWTAESEQSLSQNSVYKMLVYERGCGITLACSSGVAAVMSLFFEQATIVMHQKITILMSGGSVDAWVDQDANINLQAWAMCVYNGVFEDFFAQYQTKLYAQPRR